MKSVGNAGERPRPPPGAQGLQAPPPTTCCAIPRPGPSDHPQHPHPPATCCKGCPFLPVRPLPRCLRGASHPPAPSHGAAAVLSPLLAKSWRAAASRQRRERICPSLSEPLFSRTVGFLKLGPYRFHPRRPSRGPRTVPGTLRELSEHQTREQTEEGDTSDLLGASPQLPAGTAPCGLPVPGAAPSCPTAPERPFPPPKLLYMTCPTPTLPAAAHRSRGAPDPSWAQEQSVLPPWKLELAKRVQLLYAPGTRCWDDVSRGQGEG